MGIDLRITSKLIAAAPEDLGGRLLALLTRVQDEIGHGAMFGPLDERGRAMLAIQAHPAASPVRVHIRGPGRLVLSASTAPGGPGYHQWVCSLADRIAGELGVEWDTGVAPEEPEERTHDETGYWPGRDRGALERHMLGWLKLNGAIMRDGGVALGADRGFVRLSMGMVQFEHELPVITPMGPRSREWLKAAGEDPDGATDFFAWWDEGVTARTLLNRALVHMWSDVGWAAPGSPTQVRLERHVLEVLGRALAMDAGLDYPWREWAELLDLHGATGDLRWRVRAKAAQVGAVAGAGGGLIGYRRNEITHAIGGGWQLRLPGRLTPAPEDVRDAALDFCVAGGGTMLNVRASGLKDRAGEQAPGKLPPSIFDAPGVPTGTAITAEIPGGAARGVFIDQKSKAGAQVWGFLGEVRVPGAHANIAGRFLVQDLPFGRELLTRFIPPRSSGAKG